MDLDRLEGVESRPKVDLSVGPVSGQPARLSAQKVLGRLVSRLSQSNWIRRADDVTRNGHTLGFGRITEVEEILEDWKHQL